MKTKIKTTGKTKEFSLTKNNKVIARIAIGIDNNEKKYTITSWYTNKAYQHQGFGKYILKVAFTDLDQDYKICYIWNGLNQYVGDWLSKFDAHCECPLAVQKTQSEDDWDSHIFELNKEKFRKYIKDV